MQKLYIQFYFGLFVIFLLASCVPAPVEGDGRGEDSALTIKFKAMYDSLPAVMGNSDQIFIHNGDSIYFTDFRFFVSNVGLENQTTTDLTTVIDDDEVRQFNMPDDETAAEIGDFKDFLTQLGEYKGIRLDFGVPPELNTSEFDPNVFGSANPLADADNFSSELKSYKFFELKGEVLGAGGGPFDYKIGQERYYQNSKNLFAKSVTLTPEIDSVTFNFTIDLKKVLDKVTISDNFTLREDDLPTLGQKIMDNFTKSSIDLK